MVQTKIFIVFSPHLTVLLVRRNWFAASVVSVVKERNVILLGVP
jgi:hypothetical protein